MRYLTVLDLFSGPGGLSQGIRDARNHDFRFKIVVANDYNESVRHTYTTNHPDVEFVLGSISDEKIKTDILQAIDRTGKSTVDLVIGGPPCKGFSLENKMTRNMDNPMNHLVMHYADMVKRTRPSAFIMENVPGLFAMRDGNLIKELIHKFIDLGYPNTTAWLLNAADYGVPQFRKRAFIVGSKSEISIPKPKKTHGNAQQIKDDRSLLKHVCLADAISDLPIIRTGKANSSNDTYTSEPRNDYQKYMRNKTTTVTNHVVTKNTPIVVQRIKSVPPGGNWNDIPVELMQIDGKYGKLGMTHSMIYKRLLKKNPSVTITNFRKAMIIHPTQNRLLSVREAARIQSFPDHFKFKGGMSDMQQQVSDAVPTILARKVGESMLKHLHEILTPMVMEHIRK